MKGERHVGGEIRVLSNLIKRCMDDGMPPAQARLFPCLPPAVFLGVYS